MTPEQKYSDAFIESFEIDAAVLEGNLEYNTIAEWDSIGHMSLIAALEDAFDISMETDDIVEFSSFRKGIEIMKKYGVEIAH